MFFDWSTDPALSIGAQLEAWRSGRSVLYRRTPLATSIIAATDGEGDEDRLAR